MKKVKILTITLAIILITAIAFGGIYVQKQNRMENVVEDYKYAMDLEGTRTVRLEVDTGTTTVVKDSEGKEVKDTENLTEEQMTEKGYTKEEVPNNSEDVKNEENYKKAKEILEKRLQKMGVNNYTIKLDTQAGDIVVEIPEDDSTDTVVSQLVTVGKFTIQDSETGEVLMDNNDIKLASAISGADNTSTSAVAKTRIYLNIEFTKDGAKKLEDISNRYLKPVETENKEEATDEAATTETTETDENGEEKTEKKVTIKIDDTEIMTTNFEEPMRTGKMQLSMGGASSDQKTLQGYAAQASSIAVVLDTGNLPVKYQATENSYVLSDVTNQELSIVVYALLAVVVVALIVLIVRYKKLGALATISYIGLISVFLILIRYANVVISIEGIFAIAIVLVLNYIFVNKLLSKLKEEKLTKTAANKGIAETYKEFFIRIIPVCILAIVFCFINWSPISSFGMVMFWGITLIAIYNAIITNILLKIEADK